ncbi:uncharacterized protein LOC129731323 isoform X2 [Wyeomyia smithii]|uniref:uncharacterized protein LOC129731323 isoform X2 n=1 Tax=Wyeomyia smithii TaxID=174621 RepID=UPI002467E733|nr:uncharacterized protein LOC129731323 isoform X2 [Wyeomyia smithii]XP_055547182.1 uncharacterized protein LOC129731323 isoform X2 [Wyeomyia smithii]XP_055547183.1 uncharacterized protein LOC129731323 isoform X2 [Wyeomyia smithii]XP_055547184.1 uncharacterized protein LOC129731323 isoform X2 [Wyeomyia smithii]XP_055547185.1 uncharacterized protein LOC129731323 isoform X2 [Wyeomyia smithii]XP_055547186.1 uncharacterized protein LOC129731323 isoform X2 [Wyeomyia smithii]XP_055547187.1 uncharac
MQMNGEDKPKAGIMKFNNRNSSPEKGTTRLAGVSVKQEPFPEAESPPDQKPLLLQQQKQQISLKNKITPQQLLQLQQQQQRQPLAKRPRIESLPAEETEPEEQEEEPELDTSATESETEMDQTADDGMIVSHPSQRLDMSVLKAKGTTTTVLVTEESDSDDRIGRKNVKRKMVGKQTNTNTSTKVKLQMVHEFPTLFLGLRRNRIFLVNSLAQSFELNQRDIILTLRKIKLNEHNARLASVFGLTDSEVEVLFRTSVPKIADCLRNFIVWPDDITMKLNVPINLRQHFNKIHLILNYLVVKVRQNAVKHLSQAQSETSYCELDQCHKLKYLIASTLDGCVCFVSRGFGIRTDDEAVLAQSGFLTKFKTNTNLIAGKNFHNFEDRLTNGHDHENNNGAGTTTGIGDDSDLERTLTTSNEDDNFEEIVSEKISKSRTFKLKSYIESVLESFQGHLILSPTACVDSKTLELLELLDDVVVIVGALINLQKQEVE